MFCILHYTRLDPAYWNRNIKWSQSLFWEGRANIHNSKCEGWPSMTLDIKLSTGTHRQNYSTEGDARSSKINHVPHKYCINANWKHADWRHSENNIVSMLCLIDLLANVYSNVWWQHWRSMPYGCQTDTTLTKATSSSRPH